MIIKVIKIDPRKYGFKRPFAVSSFGVFMLTLNMFLAETSRPRLLRNTFDRSYVVKYLGLDTYSAYDLLKVHNQTKLRKMLMQKILIKYSTLLKSIMQKQIRNILVKPREKMSLSYI